MGSEVIISSNSRTVHPSAVSPIGLAIVGLVAAVALAACGSSPSASSTTSSTSGLISDSSSDIAPDLPAATSCPTIAGYTLAPPTAAMPAFSGALLTCSYAGSRGGSTMVAAWLSTDPSTSADAYLKAQTAGGLQIQSAGHTSVAVISTESTSPTCVVFAPYAHGTVAIDAGVDPQPSVNCKNDSFVYDAVVNGAGNSAGTAPSTPATPTSYYAVDGDVELGPAGGYTYKLHVTWNADKPTISVGSQPPGKTNILMSARPMSGIFTNTTVGGRSIPEGDQPTSELVALFPASSVVCTVKDDYGNPSQSPLGPAVQGSIANMFYGNGFCGVPLVEAFGVGASGGALDPGHGGSNVSGAVYPNGTPISFSASDLYLFANPTTAEAGYAQPSSSGPSWAGVDEKSAPAFLTALEHPAEFAISDPVKPYGGKVCVAPTVGGANYLAVISSNFNQSVC